MKKVISLLLVLTLMLGALCASVTQTGAASVLGDVDGDGEVDIIDVTLIQRHLAGVITLDEAAQQRGIVSGEDELSAVDATLIQRYLANLIDQFPAEDQHKINNIVNIRFTDKRNWNSVYAYFFNKATGEAPCEWPGELLTDPEPDSEGYPEYTATVDVGKYDRVIFSDGDRKKSIEAPVTKASYGFMIADKNGKKFDLDIYTGGPYSAGKILTKKFDYPGYPEGEKKTVWIYLPDGYDPDDTSKKYSVLYMDDGQVMLGTLPNDDWRCDKNVRSLMIQRRRRHHHSRHLQSGRRSRPRDAPVHRRTGMG